MAVAPKYTPNKPKDAGLEARQKLGWWRAYRFLLLRRLSQLSIILMFFKWTDVECLDLKRQL